MYACYYSLMAQTIRIRWDEHRGGSRRHVSVFWLAWLAPKVEIEFSDEPSSLAHFGGLHFQKRVSSVYLLFLMVICLAELHEWYVAFFICMADNSDCQHDMSGPMLRA